MMPSLRTNLEGNNAICQHCHLARLMFLADLLWQHSGISFFSRPLALLKNDDHFGEWREKYPKGTYMCVGIGSEPQRKFSMKWMVCISDDSAWKVAPVGILCCYIFSTRCSGSSRLGMIFPQGEKLQPRDFYGPISAIKCRHARARGPRMRENRTGPCGPPRKNSVSAPTIAVEIMYRACSFFPPDSENLYLPQGVFQLFHHFILPIYEKHFWQTMYIPVPRPRAHSGWGDTFV